MHSFPKCVSGLSNTNCLVQCLNSSFVTSKIFDSHVVIDLDVTTLA